MFDTEQRVRRLDQVAALVERDLAVRNRFDEYDDSTCLRCRAITPGGKSYKRFRRRQRCVPISRWRTGFVARAPAAVRGASSSSANVDTDTLTSRSTARATSENTTEWRPPIGNGAPARAVPVKRGRASRADSAARCWPTGRPAIS
ncbi:hypothetical protein SB394_08450 [Burkholderia sp. BCCIQ04A]|uniref:Uncharacterized protein n=1 Tax=Burkholderia anthinoferrum TaxID=3090833 RepID=A0ABU5WEF0_9BURK|nr:MULTISPECIES: hypothetical protein [Burkholderia]MEB2503776.1 hypothetical protein [Burkholderia anthinoferrum]MEB2534255.1 hypothetical protein [Burkholderia anthinoferrum]MEB2560225.1 hypothetical protein [Burkholderia anthinoferrum]MEB2577475.1 hypothetical protein [Burkholderia anthinoferrum]MCA8105453.1 hypothetical protein [Burkholderia sp. AU36459]